MVNLDFEFGEYYHKNESFDIKTMEIGSWDEVGQCLKGRGCLDQWPLDRFCVKHCRLVSICCAPWRLILEMFSQIFVDFK